ncbi:MAG: hypothetical protein AAFX59_14420 [Pseudomonadota bacterium]
MIPFLESFGTEKAERCLAEFASCVRNIDDTGLSDSSSAVLEGEMAALTRRAAAARVELAEQKAEIARMQARLCAAINAAELARNGYAADGTLATLIEELRLATDAFEADRRGVARAGQWLSDLDDARARLAAHLAGGGQQNVASGAGRALVRAISEISVALDAMTVAARNVRQEQDAQREAGRDQRLEDILRNRGVSGQAEPLPSPPADPSDMLHRLMRALTQAGMDLGDDPGQLRKLH